MFDLNTWYGNWQRFAIECGEEAWTWDRERIGRWVGRIIDGIENNARTTYLTA